LTQGTSDFAYRSLYIKSIRQLFRSPPTVNKRLSYRRGTARRVMLVNSCCVLRDMGVRKVPNS